MMCTACGTDINAEESTSDKFPLCGNCYNYIVFEDAMGSVSFFHSERFRVLLSRLDAAMRRAECHEDAYGILTKFYRWCFVQSIRTTPKT